MRLQATQQVDIEALKTLDFDLVVAASGFERRASHASRFIKSSSGAAKLVFAFGDRMNDIRHENDKAFAEMGFDTMLLNGDDGTGVALAIVTKIESIPSNSARIFIDYSSMTRAWYAAIISSVRGIRNKAKIDFYFSYSPAKFEAPNPPAPNQSVSPVPGFGGLDIPDLPSALVVGLGYEKDRAIGLLDYIDPALCLAFITDPPLSEEYLHTVKKNNASFLNAIGAENHYRHPLSDLQRTSNLLLSVVWGLMDSYRVILAPLGVKPFSLMCLLLAYQHREVDVWRVSTGVKGGYQTREPMGPLLILKAEFAM